MVSVSEFKEPIDLSSRNHGMAPPVWNEVENETSEHWVSDDSLALVFIVRGKRSATLALQYGRRSAEVQEIPSRIFLLAQFNAGAGFCVATTETR
jgi:hypothetical protein